MGVVVRGGGSRDCSPTKHNKEERTKNQNFKPSNRFWKLSCRRTLRMCIPTRVVSPAVTSTAGFLRLLRANIARMSKTRPNPVSQQQQRKFTSMKPTTNNSSSACKSNCKETPACPVVTYLSIVSVFSLIMLTNFQHSPTPHPQTRRRDPAG